MSRLTAEKCPELTEEAVKKLRKIGIITALDFLAESVERLSEKTCLSVQELSVVRRSLLLESSALALSGSQLFEEMSDSLIITSTGCANLDHLLGGGLYSKEVTELYGSPAVGKTQSCLSIACHIATEYKKNVVYIDTGGGFSSERIKEMVSRKCGRDAGNELGYLNDLTRIQCITAFDIFSAISELEKVTSSLSVQEDGFCQDVILVVVDSVASLISPILGETQNHGHALMVSLGRMLKSLAMDYNVAVLVTNNAVSDFTLNSYTKPALGKTWSHIPHNRIHMYHSSHQPSQRLVKMTKSCRMPLQVITTATITESGLRS